MIRKTDLIPNILAYGGTQLLGNTFGSTCGGNTTRLSMANQSTLVDFASAQS